MPGQPVAAGASFAAGLRSEALGTYRRMYEGVRERLSSVMDLDYPAGKRVEDYFFWNSAPNLIRWPYGQELASKSFVGVKYSITNYRWAMAIEWQADDRSDDQTKSLLDQARQLGLSLATLDERAFFQMLLGATDADLLPSVPNAPDGNAFFASTTPGRFGVGGAGAGGNIVTGGGVTTSALIQTDYFKTLAIFGLMQDTEGQPLFDPQTIESPKLIIYGAGINSNNPEFMVKAFRQNIQQGSSAGVSNVTDDINDVPILWQSQRVTGTGLGNDWFVFLTASPTKPTFSQLREPLSEVVATKENSDQARKQDQEYIRFKVRKGMGIHTPYAGTKVDNT